MDNAATRRGKQTLHLTFSNKKALMICHDVMYMVYLIWNEHRPSHVSLSDWEHFISYHLQRLMVGQAYDLEKKGTLIELASMKTGVLFELVAETVAICTHLDTTVWRLWGNHLGILFQWMDDWQDREEDTLQQNRNAFNEAYTVTLSYYGRIWERVEQVIGPTWFDRPFGKFMKKYFTSGIPLPVISTTLLSLSHIFLPYPTPALPTLPDIDSDQKRELASIILDPNRTVLINRRNVYDLTPSDIEQLLRSKQPAEIRINDQIHAHVECDDLFHLKAMEWVQSFNENNITKINGKQIIRIMIQVVKRLEQIPRDVLEPYRELYESLRQKIWSIEETEWEYQPEVIDFIYQEIQLTKKRQGLLDS